MYQSRTPIVTSPTCIAILGCGYWGINYVRVFSELPDAFVAVVCDERPSRLDEVCRRFPGVLATTDIDEALAVPGVEAAVVATQAQTHRDIAARALAAGKHVLVEKPLTTTVADADVLVQLARAERRTLLVGHTFLYNAGVKKVKEYITNTSLGDVYYLYARRTSLGPIRHDVNAIWDLASHDVAIFNYLLETPPEWVSAVGAKVLRNSREDVGFISLGYRDGIVGHIHVSWADPNKVREVVVVGSNRRVVFNDLEPLERVRVFDKGVAPLPTTEATSFGEYQFLLRDGDITSPTIPVIEPLKHVCGHFLHCLRRSETPITDGQQGREVVRVMEGINKSVAANGSPVRLHGDEPITDEELQFASAIR
jgi:predicted dehydrogenase